MWITKKISSFGAGLTQFSFVELYAKTHMYCLRVVLLLFI